MQPYKDYAHKKREINTDEDVMSGILVIAALSAILGIMMGMSV
tara:strand:- start:206 stop:334 length:129 start_codon:yes stop_codon:yes gene_type:complete